MGKIEQCIYKQKLSEKFPHFDFSKFEYKNSYTKSVIICKYHGVFYNSYKELIRQKYGCHGCLKNKPKIQEVIEGFCEKHGKYLYKRYNSPNCLECNIERLTDTHESFLNKLWNNNKHYREGEFKVVGEYTRSSKHIAVETAFGVCLCTPNHLTKGKLPTIRSAVDKTEYAINEFKSIYSDKYKYPNFNYGGSNKKFTVLCEKHGEFKTHYSSFKTHKCKKCAHEELDIGFTREDFIRISSNRTATMYLVLVSLNNEEFLKIGITSRALKTRLSGFDYKVVSIIESNNVGWVFDTEKIFLERFKKYKYKPNRRFNGHTECFKVEYIEELKNDFRRIQNLTEGQTRGGL